MKKNRMNLRYLTREGLRSLYVNHLMSFASVSVLFSCLVMIGLAFLVLVNLNQMIDNLEEQNVIMVFVEDGASEEEQSQLGSTIRALSYVGSAEFVSKEDALEQMMQEFGSTPELLTNLEQNPLPDAYKVTVSDMARFDETVTRLQALPQVFSTRENHEIASQLAGTRNSLSAISLGIIGVLLLVSLFIISNTIRVTMSTRELEISIMKSVGATNSFIRWPFMVEGILLGIISALLSLLAVWGVYRFMLRSMHFLAGTLFGDAILRPFRNYAYTLLAGFLLIGVFTGIFGSTFSIRRYLKEKGFVEVES